MVSSYKKALKDALFVRDIFLKNDIKYFITGSFAVSTYLGRGHFGDIDFVIASDDFEKATALLGLEPTEKKNTAGYFKSIVYGDIEVNTFSGIHNKLGIKPFTFDKEYYSSKLLTIKNHHFRFASVEYIVLQKLLLNRGEKDTGAVIDLAKQYRLNHLNLIFQSFLLGILLRYLKYVVYK